MENPNLIQSPDGVGPSRIPWKLISILLLIAFSALFFLYIFSVRNRNKLRRMLSGLQEENEVLQGVLDDGKTELEALKKARQQPATYTAPAPPNIDYRPPVINPGLKFNIQPVPEMQMPAFRAWNNGETLYVLAVLDYNGGFGEFRNVDTPPAPVYPAWVFQLFSIGGAKLFESNIPIEGQQPDGKRIVSEIRALLESGIAPETNP